MSGRKNFAGVAVLAVSLVLTSCSDPSPFPEAEFDQRLAGGTNTVFDNTSKAFGHAFPTIPEYDLRIHGLGDKQFEQTFVTAPAPVNSGLGPLYNNVSCISCHHNDGTGVPTTGTSESSLLLRISRPGTDEHGGPLGIPGYGTQIQDKAVFGKSPECRIDISYSMNPVQLSEGEHAELRIPEYSLVATAAPLPAGYLLSPRLAPAVFGLGLLEAIPEGDILAHADEFDVNQDGISGKPNRVWDPVSSSTQLGRFGWKANTASLLAQVAGAYNQDMGITTSVLPVEAVIGQLQYDYRSDDPELADSLLHAVVFYVRSLAVPARRNVASPDIMRGSRLFQDIGCAGCHIPSFTTAVNQAFPSLSHQRIYPYSDLLLHDMGPGLSDNRPDFIATGSEWRTAPLWGLGLYEVVNYPAYYLHDGRARTILEAILWHDGEAAASAAKVKSMARDDRNALLKFLRSL